MSSKEISRELTTAERWRFPTTWVAGGFGGPNQIGGTTPESRNLFSGNKFADFGSAVDSSPNTYFFQGNYVGTDRTCTQPLGLTGGFAEDGVAMVIGGTTAGAGNLFSGGSVGVGFTFPASNPFTPDSNIFQGNLVGTDPTGTTGVTHSGGITIDGGTSNLIGGTTPAARNVIAGLPGYGITLQNGAQLNTIQGNFIGVNVTGTTALPNFLGGIHQFVPGGNGVFPAGNLIGGESAGAGNVISGNTGPGIEAGGGPEENLKTGGTLNQSTIVGNIIGADVTGTTSRLESFRFEPL